MDTGTNRSVRTTWAAIVAVLVQAGCASTAVITRSAPAQHAPVRRLVLIEVDGPIDWIRFLDEIRADGLFEIEDASDVGIRLSELGEGDIGEAARRFRAERPADVYVRLGVTYERGYYHPIHAEYDYGWETSRIDVAMRDATTGRLLANLSATESEDWASSDSFRRPVEVRPPWVAAEIATAKAIDAAAKLSLKNLEGRLQNAQAVSGRE
jgi:hypothetical protein